MNKILDLFKNNLPGVLFLPESLYSVIPDFLKSFSDLQVILDPMLDEPVYIKKPSFDMFNLPPKIQDKFKEFFNTGKIKGDLDLSGLNITSLPQGLKVGSYLDLSNTHITSLPQGLEVGWSLYLRDTPITSLPQGLKVGGYLDLSRTPLTSLPEGLQVGESLLLNNTYITSLPHDLKVGGIIYKDF